MKGVGALVGVGVAGLFVGALVMEVIHRARPNFVKDVQASTKKAFSDMGSAFKEGYYGMKVDEKALGETD